MVMTQSILGVGNFDLLKTHSQFILQRSWFYFLLSILSLVVIVSATVGISSPGGVQ